MEKKFDFPAGELRVKKVTHKKKPVLRMTLDSDTTVDIGYEYETARDRAFDGFDQRNADLVYRTMMNLTGDL